MRELPEGWAWKTLSDVLSTLENGNRPKGGIKDIEEGIPSIGGEHISPFGGFKFDKVKLIPEDFYDSMKRGKLNLWDVLVVKDGATTGKVSIVKNDFPFSKAAVNEHVFLLRGIPDVLDQHYLFFHMFSPSGQSQVLKTFHGAAIGGINTQFIKNYHIPLPPLPTQRRIVAILEKAEQVKNWHSEQSRLLDDYLKSVFLEMFGDPMQNEMNWKIETVGNLSESRLGKMLDKKQIIGNNLKFYLGNSNVKWFDFDLNDLLEMDFSQEEQDKFELKNGDVLICEGGDIGRSAIWQSQLSDCYYQKALHRLRADEQKLNPYYFVHLMFFYSKFGGFKDYATQSTIAHLTGFKLKKMPIPVPPIDLQSKFAAIVQHTEKVKAQHEKSAKQADDLFNALMQKAFTGELVA
ncbi:MAG: restriction endonuclease subunit S [Thermoplasmata archaeon]|nr:restriction endonuclease subunit S [Thermoplasmata archaeon]